MRNWQIRILGGLCSVMVAVVALPGALPAHGEVVSGGPQLYLDTTDGVAAISAADGTPSFSSPSSRASGDWSRLISAEPSGDSTTVRAIDARDGSAGPGFVVLGEQHLRVVSYRGDLVALSPHTPGRHGRQPGRARTTIVVAATDGHRARTYDLTGNIEPEAFSNDGRAMFVVQYLPPLHPDRYQVRTLDLTSGSLGEVASPDGATQGQMPGVARTQLLAPDGSRLYTLYTSTGATGDDYSFVHVLDLDEQWAHCVDLPPPFGRDPSAMGLAIDPNGTTVYVADVATGRLAAVDTTSLAVERVGRSAVRGHHARPQLAASSSLVYVAVERTLTAVQAESFVPRFHESLSSRVRGLALPASAPLLYVAQRRSIDGLDPTTGERATSVAVDLPRLAGLGYEITPPGGNTIKCAC